MTCKDADVAKSHLRSNWGEYFYSIKQQCPWSYAAWQRGQISVVEWTGVPLPLGDYEARVYLIDEDNDTVERIAQVLDRGEYEWLFSYPGYGKFATPESVLIQQLRSTLTELRKKNG